MLVAIPLALVGAASALAVWRWPVRWAQALIWILVLQNAAVIAAWKLTGSGDFARNLLYAKEAVIAGGAVVALVAITRLVLARRLPAPIWMALAFCTLCTLWVPLSWLRDLELEQIARGLRSLVFPVLLLVVGFCLLPGLRAGLALRRTLWWTGILLGVAAVVERSLVPPQFWVDIGLERYWVDVKGQSPEMLNGGLPWNYFVPLLGETVRRAFGIMTDPLGLSYYLLLPLALALGELWRSAGRRLPLLPAAAGLLSAVGIAFSLSRLPIAIAGALVVLAPLVALGLTRRRWREALAMAAASAAVFGVVCLVSVVTTPRVDPATLAAKAPINLGSEGAHVVSLLRATDVGRLVPGQGLGTAGYLSAKYAESGGEIGYENPYLDAAAQVGILGGLLLAGVLVSTTVVLLRARGTLVPLSLPTGATLGMLAAAGVFSGQLEVITSLGVTWLFAGVVLAAAAGTEAGLEDAVPDRHEVHPGVGPPRTAP